MKIQDAREEILKKIQNFHIEYDNKMLIDGEVFIDSKGNFIDPENIKLKKKCREVGSEMLQ